MAIAFTQETIQNQRLRRPNTGAFVSVAQFNITPVAGSAAAATLPIFPTLRGEAFPNKRTVEWRSPTHRSVNGKRYTLGTFIYPIYHYELSYDSGSGGFLRSAAAYLEYQELLAFFNKMGGRRSLFQYNDTDDNTVTAQNFGTGDGTTTAFQLVRTLSGSLSTTTEPVWAPSINNIFNNGTIVNPMLYTVGETGLITFTTAPVAAHALTWTGIYRWICRMDDDTSTFEQFMSALVENSAVKFSSEKI